MSGRLRLHDAQERDVVRIWRHGHLSPSTILLYLRWVRHFRDHCQKHGLSETDALTLEGAVRFAQSYIGPRKKGPVGTSSRSTVRNALHAWACALYTLGIPAPPWLQPRGTVVLEPLLEAYVGPPSRSMRHRRRNAAARYRNGAQFSTVVAATRETRRQDDACRHRRVCR